MIRLFSLLIICISATFFYTTDTYAAKGELQYCFYKGRWSQIFKRERNYISNTRWCKIIQKSDNPNLYNDIFRKSIGHDNKWWIETKTLERIVSKYDYEDNKKEETKNNSNSNNFEIDENLTIAEQLEQLAKLYDNGALNEQEFKKAKKRILDGN